MYRDGRRKNFYDGKGHMSLEPDLAVCQAVLTGAQLAHFNIPNWARKLLPLARELGVKIAVDLQDVVSPDDSYRRDFIEVADFLFFSAANHPDPSPLIQHFLGNRPDRIVVCGMGAAGCALGTGAGIQFFDPVALPEPVIDTNGAGDTLATGFLSSYVLRGFSLEDAVLRGQIAARHTCAQRASSFSLITIQQLDERHAAISPPAKQVDTRAAGCYT